MPGWPTASAGAALVAETGLKDAVIVPTPADPEQIAPVLGRATADYLARHLGENRARALGIGWGATLRETVRHLASANQRSSASTP